MNSLYVPYLSSENMSFSIEAIEAEQSFGIDVIPAYEAVELLDFRIQELLSYFWGKKYGITVAGGFVAFALGKVFQK